MSSSCVFNFHLAVSQFGLGPGGGPHHDWLKRTTTRFGFPSGSGAGVDASDSWGSICSSWIWDGA